MAHFKERLTQDDEKLRARPRAASGRQRRRTAGSYQRSEKRRNIAIHPVDRDLGPVTLGAGCLCDALECVDAPLRATAVRDGENLDALSFLVLPQLAL